VTDALVRRLANKILWHQDEIIQTESYRLEDADRVIIAYGSTARPAKAAVQMAREEGIRAGLFKLLTLWPFPGEEVRKISGRAEKIFVAELNLGQILGEVERFAHEDCCVEGIQRVDGALLTPEAIFARLQEGRR